MAFFADILAPVNLKFVIHPVVAADVQLAGIWAVFECADVGTEIAEYMTPMNSFCQRNSDLVALRTGNSLP